MENRVASIRNIIDKDSWCHISGVINPADTPTRVCKINDFERWFEDPQFLHTDVDVSKFDVWERLKLVEAVVQNEAKVGKKDFDGAAHIVLDVDKDLKVGSVVCF